MFRHRSAFPCALRRRGVAPQQRDSRCVIKFRLAHAHKCLGFPQARRTPKWTAICDLNLCAVTAGQKTDGGDLKRETLDFNIFSYWLFQNGEH